VGTDLIQYNAMRKALEVCAKVEVLEVHDKTRALELYCKHRNDNEENRDGAGLIHRLGLHISA